jgi:hypothetical protein
MIIKYLYINRYYTIAISYFLLSILLKMHGIVDITIPCFFSYVFDLHCPGCGLTRAFIEILRLNFKEAWSYNPIIFIIIPSMGYFIIKDYFKYKLGFLN